ncbi:hypothetical protein, partial [Escherichia coli]
PEPRLGRCPYYVSKITMRIINAPLKIALA